jgi:hypothetical protein
MPTSKIAIDTNPERSKYILPVFTVALLVRKSGAVSRLATLDTAAAQAGFRLDQIQPT